MAWSLLADVPRAVPAPLDCIKHFLSKTSTSSDKYAQYPLPQACLRDEVYRIDEVLQFFKVVSPKFNVTCDESLNEFTTSFLRGYA